MKVKARPPAPLALLVAAAAVLGGGAARGQPALFGTAEVSAGGGEDSNMFLPVSVDPAMRPPLVGGWFGRVAPRLSAALAGGGWRLEGSYALDYRASDAAGRLADQRVDLALAFPRLGRLAAVLTASAGRFDPSRFGDDRFLFAAGELALRLEITPPLRLSGAYRAELRRYPARGQSDLLHIAEARVAYRPEARGGGWYLALDPVRASLTDNGDLRLVRVGPDLELVLGRLSLGAWGWGGFVDGAGTARLWQVGGGVGALYRLADVLDAVFTADWAGSPGSADVAAADYARRYLALTLVGHLTGRHAWAHSAAADADLDLAPAVRDGRVRLRVRAAGATAVTVIGSWDGWEAPGRPLSATRQPGLWEAWIELPPGPQRYRFLVDGTAMRPSAAPRYVPDDFGGEDAVIDMPEAP
jgi:hypothetical protein